MTSRMTSFARHNAIALAALFIALGGTSYAAISLPAGSVGTNQIKNAAITPIKLNSGLIGGSIRAWAYVANGKIVAGRGLGLGPEQSDTYGLYLKNKKTNGCGAVASVTEPPLPSAATTPHAPGFALAGLSSDPRPGSVLVQTFSVAGQPAPLPFVVEVLC